DRSRNRQKCPRVGRIERPVHLSVVTETTQHWNRLAITLEQGIVVGNVDALDFASDFIEKRREQCFRLLAQMAPEGAVKDKLLHNVSPQALPVDRCRS